LNWTEQSNDLESGECAGYLGGFIPSPGFTIQEDDQPPVLTITFEDMKTAEQCASSMREIIAKATEIMGRD